jgi:sugar phosphate isomerase/epimerase
MAAPRAELLSLNTATVKRQWNLAQAIEGCARHGIRGISPWRDQVQALGLNETRQMIEAHGLAVTGLCRGGFFTSKDWLEDNLAAIEEARVLGARCLVLVVGGAGGRRPAGGLERSACRSPADKGRD